jgi:hypothetical protein
MPRTRIFTPLTCTMHLVASPRNAVCKTRPRNRLSAGAPAAAGVRTTCSGRMSAAPGAAPAASFGAWHRTSPSAVSIRALPRGAPRVVFWKPI